MAVKSKRAAAPKSKSPAAPKSKSPAAPKSKSPATAKRKSPATAKAKSAPKRAVAARPKTAAKAKSAAKPKSPVTAKQKTPPKTAAKAKSAAKAPQQKARKTPAAARRTAPAPRKVPERTDGLQQVFEPYKPRRGEKYMSEGQKTHFRGILLNWKAQLMEEVDRTVSHMQDEAAKFPDPTDRASQEEEFNLELKTRDRERKLIRKIDATIDLIDQDDYGYCVTCGVEIGIRRLEARPTATQCIDCKTLDEIKERQILGT